LLAAGAVVVEYPTTVVGPPPTWAPLDAALARLSTYDWLVFTSATAVRFVAERWPAHMAPESLSRPQIAAVGEETAQALMKRHFSVALVPADQRQEGLVEALADVSAGARVLFPRAVDGREHLVAALAARGISVDVVPASQTLARDPLPPLPPFDIATFASPSALDAFFAGHGAEALGRHPLVVIGATTAAAATARGLRPVVAHAPNIAALIDALAKLVPGRGGG
jgi:uroporphyrinogen III methyltransferase/synthase